jgi:hypothetical protein
MDFITPTCSRCNSRDLLVEEEAAARISFRLEELYDQTRLAAEARDSILLESILRELTLLNDMQS